MRRGNVASVDTDKGQVVPYHVSPESGNLEWPSTTEGSCGRERRVKPRQQLSLNVSALQCVLNVVRGLGVPLSITTFLDSDGVAQHIHLKFIQSPVDTSCILWLTSKGFTVFDP